MVRWETSFEEETLGLDAAREEARTRLAGRGRRLPDGQEEKAGGRSTAGAPHGAPREPRKEHLLLRRTLGVRKA